MITITLRHLSKFFLYATVLSVVVVLSSTFFPFIGGKYFFFRTTVSLSLIFLLLSWAFEMKEGELEEKLRKVFAEPLFIAVSVFVLAVMLSTIFANNPYGAFWSNYERGEGAFQMLHYYAFFVLMLVLLDKDKDWRFLFKLSMIAALLMIGYGLEAAQFRAGFIGPYNHGVVGEETFFKRIFTSGSRFQGSLGNPAYVAPYLMFIMAFTLYLWLSPHVKKIRNSIARNALFITLLLVYFTFFSLSQTRGAFLGLAAGVFVYFGYLIFVNAKWRKKAAIALAAIIVAVSFLVANREHPIVKKLPGNRALYISLSEDTAQTRFWTWGTAIEGFKERPIFGWGLENFSAVFDKHFDTRHFVPGQSTETWFDRAHSIAFDYLSETGILGFTAYIGIFAAYYVLLFAPVIARIRKKHVDERHFRITHHSYPVQAIFAAAPAAYFVQGLFLFDVLPIYLNLFVFLAFANYAFAGTGDHAPAEHHAS